MSGGDALPVTSPHVGSSTAAAASPGVGDPVIIVTIDGVRWQEIFDGTDPSRSASAPRARKEDASHLVPRLYALGTKRGAFVGAPGFGTISATGPQFISLPGYNEILSGRAPLDCSSNECERTRRPSLLDEAAARGARVAAFASWEKIDRAITVDASHRAFHVDCGRGSPPTEQLVGSEDSRPDRLTAAAALAYYEAERPDVFYLGLGDPDEYAHLGDYDAYVSSIRFADEVVGRLMDIVDHDPNPKTRERSHRTHIVVSPDHGRAKDFRSHGGFESPEASRVWLMAAGPRITARGFVSSPSPHHLADIAPTLRLVLGLPDATSSSRGELGSPIDELLFEPTRRMTVASTL